jgi:hypothetical protein
MTCVEYPSKYETASEDEEIVNASYPAGEDI